MRYYGKNLHLIEGPQENIKITTPDDFYIMRAIIDAKENAQAVLELAREKNAAMVYVSSMEVYGNPNLTHEVSEEDYGYINLSNVRSSYPESKRMCECLCTAYASQYGVQVCTARLAQTFGAGILATENRVFAQFARSAISGSDIVLHTLGQSEGNYVYTSDAIHKHMLKVMEKSILYINIKHQYIACLRLIRSLIHAMIFRE